MSDYARGGDDTLRGGTGSSTNFLYGDAEEMHDNAIGGDNVLIGGGAGSVNYIYGAGFAMFDNTVAGHNTLISGLGTDYMWGDAQFINGVLASPTAPTGNVTTGADTFVFAPNNGNDFVGDFRQSDGDKIDVSAYGFTSMAAMTFTAVGGDTKIGFDANNSATLVGISDPNTLHASDFIFA
jgi:hypothetical protein